MTTQKRLKELFSYNPDIGDFIRSCRASNMAALSLAGSVNHDGYIRIRVDGKKYMAHRLAWLYVHGEFPSNQIDHINHNRSDNRITNLRNVTHQENMRNQGVRACNSSGITGVSWDKDSEKWKAQIVEGGKKVNLGRFERIADAAAARNDANERAKYHANHGASHVS